MPAFVAHSLFGLDVKRATPRFIRDFIQSYPAAYEWGLQGPDLLFYNIPLPLVGTNRINRLGARLHEEKIDELWNALLARLAALKGGREYNVVLAYVLGFCCHYSLDSHSHPYVFCLQQRAERKLPAKERKGVHIRLESNIDTDIFRMKTGNNIRCFRLPTCMDEDQTVYMPIARLYQNLCITLFGEHVELAPLKRCFDCALLELRFLMGRVIPLLKAKALDAMLGHRIALAAHVRRAFVWGDILNLRHAQWKNPASGAISERSYPELEGKALCLAVELQQRIWEAAQNGMPEFFDELPSFNNGRPAG